MKILASIFFILSGNSTQTGWIVLSRRTWNNWVWKYVTKVITIAQSLTIQFQHIFYPLRIDDEWCSRAVNLVCELNNTANMNREIERLRRYYWLIDCTTSDGWRCTTELIKLHIMAKIIVRLLKKVYLLLKANESNVSSSSH